MKVYIAYETTDTPWGGGNQFIRALKNNLTKRNIITNNPQEADIILFNSHHHVEEVLSLKSSYPSKKFVHQYVRPER
jgi:hypothetical protein